VNSNRGRISNHGFALHVHLDGTAIGGHLATFKELSKQVGFSIDLVPTKHDLLARPRDNRGGVNFPFFGRYCEISGKDVTVTDPLHGLTIRRSTLTIRNRRTFT
jgi:hypothetical protein